MPFTAAAKNLMLDALADVAVWVSLHDAAPGGSGANELSGGAPAYARKLISWPAASGGTLDDATNGLVFDVPPDSAVNHIGVWSADTAGTFLMYKQVDEEAFNNQGQYTVTNGQASLPDAA